MRKSMMSTIGVSALALLVLTGCGAGTNNTSNTAGTSNTANASGAASTTTTKNTSGGGKTVIVGGQQYQGSANLKKYQAAAKSKPNSAQAQLNAGVASHVNGDDAAAIAYYKKAIALDPKSAIAYNNIGNIYLRDKKDVKTAIGYYQQATKADPTYGYGWWNLAIAESQAGNNQAAQQAVTSGLKSVKTSDPVYKSLQAMQKELKSSK
ncbi:tetratricopeptide repeat protein [Alicyclobacillus fastidiosus]|uniref:Tetratricopeptide repeat protein n=1 Tax=Alicyclobacillus fastidiosus TaxID=392011 RepID=A0ABY6ZI32_9BACL|nr:tetratricopeptide repeat protein [Alicyclobacillus fastidiosus]WAH41774.1 tetratricopeptide repeat protein [Alicyclobacillus fastidiosus]GMA63469.1 hypothetical protein GCM10025859_39090 [Alicyclobacillus fastidiosus]